LTGDERGGDAVTIIDHAVQADFLFTPEEADWLRSEYEKRAGRPLHLVTTADVWTAARALGAVFGPLGDSPGDET
jgi:hypothetical protein